MTEVRDRLRERAALAAQIADDDFADVPPSRLLRALRGKDVLLVFVESYGKVALEGLPTSSQLRDSVDADSSRLEAAGYDSRSAYLTSPTFGAMSWLAHSTLQSGLWIDNQGTYDLLLRPRPAHAEQRVRQGGLALGGHDPRRHRALARGPALLPVGGSCTT